MLRIREYLLYDESMVGRVAEAVYVGIYDRIVRTDHIHMVRLLDSGAESLLVQTFGVSLERKISLDSGEHSPFFLWKDFLT